MMLDDGVALWLGSLGGPRCQCLFGGLGFEAME